MYSDKLIIELNFRNRFIDESRQEPFDSRRMYDLLSETILDKRTLEMIEIHDLYKSLDHTMTLVGSARLFHSLNTPSESLELIQAKQEALLELETNDKLKKAVIGYLNDFSKKEKSLFKFLNVNYHPLLSFGPLRKAIDAVKGMLKGVEKIPAPHSGYLESLLRLISNFGESQVSELVQKPTYRTFRGVKTGKEKGAFSPGFRFRAGRLSGGTIGPALPSIIFGLAWITGKMNPALAESMVLFTGAGAVLGILYAFIAKPVFDNETAILPIRNRFINSNRFASAVEAVASLDELISFYNFRQCTQHTTVIPELSNKSRHYFIAEELKNPVLVKSDLDFVANDVHLDGEGVSFITGPNSGGKTTYCKTIVQSQIMGQIGGPVVAEKASMNIAEHIAYQAPAFDSLSDAEGRFGTELRTTRDIFYATTPKSLVILDEIAEGTTVHEKMNLSVAILNGFFAVGNSTLLVTHSYELAEMYQDMEKGQFLQVEFDGEVPTHHMKEGISWESHADRVAKKVGFAPDDIQQHLKEKGYLLYN